jgi:hypothetical protein
LPELLIHSSAKNFLTMRHVVLLSALRYIEQSGVVVVIIFVDFSTDKTVTLTVILQFL